MAWLIDKVKEIVKPVELATGEGIIIEGQIIRPNNATGYTANDIIGNAVSSVFELPNVARKPGGSWWLNAIELEYDQGGASWATGNPIVWLFRQYRPTPLVDNVAYALTPAQKLQMQFLDRLALGSFVTPPATTIDTAQISDLARHYKCASDKTSVYFELQTLSALTTTNFAIIDYRFHITRD